MEQVMSGKRKAQRIREEAEIIFARLAKGETTIKELAVEYRCHTITMVKYVTAVIGAVRWRQVVYHRGPPKGHTHYKPKEPTIKAHEIDTGPHCWYCTQPLTPDTRVCGNCRTLQQG